MIRKKISLIIISIIFYTLAFSQEEFKTVIVDNDTLVVSAIPLSNVSMARGEVYKEIKSIGDKISSYQDQHVFDSLSDIGKRIIEDGAIKIENTIDKMSEREILDARNNWTKTRRILNSWKEKFNARISEVDAMYKKTDLMLKQWTLTLDDARKEKAVDQLRISIENTLNDIQKINTEVRDKQNQFYLNQNTVTEFILEVDKILDLLDEKSSALKLKYFIDAAPPIWVASDTTGNLKIAKNQFKKYQIDSYADMKRFWDDYQTEMIFQIIIFLVLLTSMFFLNRFSISIDNKSSDMMYAKSVVSSFFITALFLTLFSSVWFYPIRPSIINEIIRSLLIVTSFFFFHILFEKRSRVYIISGFIILLLVNDLLAVFGGKEFLLRIILFFEAIISALILIYAIRKSEQKLWLLKLKYWAVFNYLAPLFVILTIAILIGNTFGFVDLSILLINTVVKGIFNAIILIILTLILNSLVIVLFETRYLQKSNIIKEQKLVLINWITSTFNVITIAVWIAGIIKNLGFSKTFWGWVNGLLDISWHIGAVTISIGKFFTVLLVIAMTIAVFRIVNLLLNKEIFPRVQLPRGVPGAISMIIRYTIVGFGFYFVLSAAGIDLGKFGLMAGALGVGIGFGLQNIVYNFIAGLVLAFERPIQVGDVIEVGTLMGTVTSIGVRSSNVRTFEGSEVIVPNGNLISKEVVNWTLSDRKKRREIQVGVAYGSNPQQVMEILTKVTGEHVSVLETPSPWATFEGFGDSSLNFKIRFWVPFDIGVTVKSQVATSSYAALEGAGIQIPFPQQDVYIKSIDKDYRDVTEQKFNTPGFDKKDTE